MPKESTEQDDFDGFIDQPPFLTSIVLYYALEVHTIIQYYISMRTLEEKVIHKLRQPKVQKRRYTFILNVSTKEALARWCKDQGLKESPALDVMIRELVPEKYFR